MQQFPNEIWLEIFKWIDILSLMKLRLVCHRFYDLIEYVLKTNLEWKKLAKKAILDECLDLTMQRAYPYVLVTHWTDIHDPVLWRGTYLSYKKWQKVLVNPHTKDTIAPPSNFKNLSCMCTFDNYLVIASDNGSIANYTIDNISQPFYVVTHGTGLIQVEFWYSEGDVLVVSVGDDWTLKFWDLQNKIEITTDGFYANSISSGECRHFCIGDMEGTLNSYERVGNRIFHASTLNLEITLNQCRAHLIDGKYLAMTLESYGGEFYLYRAELEDGKLMTGMDQEICRFPVQHILCDLKRFTMLTTTFFSGICGASILTTNYYEHVWHEYNVGRHFGSNVKSIALHAQILMLGLEDGSILLLYIPYYEYVKGLEERIKHSKKIKVDTEPIVDLTIMEVNKKPCIIAITDRKVHLINFF